MKSWITSNPIIAGAVAAIILALGMALILGYFNHKTAAEERHDNTVFNSGVITERAEQQQETINVVQNAQRPVTANELNSVCDKYDRNCPHRP